MSHKFLAALLSAFLFANAWAGDAPPQKKIARIGYISGTGSAANQGPYVDALRDGLRKLGHVEGKSFTIEYRGAEGRMDRVSNLVAELIELPVDLIVAPILPAIVAAKQSTKVIPIVMVANVEPVASKLVDSLARPGGNLTGLSTLAQDLSGKRIELIKEVVPRLSRIAVLRDVESQNSAIQFKEYEDAARMFNITLHPLDVRGANPDLEAALLAASKGRNDALVTITNANLFTQQKRITNLAIKHKLASMFQGSTWVDSGGLMSYATDELGAFRRAATYIDKILKGVKPADLPVEQATKFELVINLKTAKQIGLAIPQSLLFRADRVIK